MTSNIIHVLFWYVPGTPIFHFIICDFCIAISDKRVNDDEME